MRGGLSITGRSVRQWRNLRRFLSAPRAGGFTIIETMIVLAVTGALFLSAAIMISGRQNRTAFEQAIRDIHSRIEQAMNEVSIGYYPNMGNFNCTVSGSGSPVISSIPGGGEQGVNSDCIFLGKAIQFQAAGTDPTGQEQFRIYTLVGRRISSTTPGAEADSLTVARPVVISPTTTQPSIPDNTVTGQLQNGLKTVSMVWGSGSIPTGVVAFSQSLAKYSGGLIQSGSQQVDVAPISSASYSMTLGMTQLEAAESINRNFVGSTPNPTGGVRICFASGGTNQSGLITIGAENRALAVRLDIKSNKTCS